MNCPICGKPYESMKRNKFGGAEYHHAGDPLNVFCQQSSASYKAAQQYVQRTAFGNSWRVRIAYKIVGLGLWLAGNGSR